MQSYPCTHILILSVIKTRIKLTLVYVLAFSYLVNLNATYMSCKELSPSKLVSVSLPFIRSSSCLSRNLKHKNKLALLFAITNL